MPPYIYHSATVAGPAAQDAFDVKLNQTIFAAAFGLGGLIFLGVLAYVSFWLVGRCSGRRDSKLDKIPPKALLLPTQLNEKTRASHASSSLFPGIGNDTEKLDLDAGMPQHGRRRFWFSKMRDTTADFMVRCASLLRVSCVYVISPKRFQKHAILRLLKLLLSLLRLMSTLGTLALASSS